MRTGQRLLRGIGANLLGQLVSTGIQLVGVPVLLRAWGVGLYGEWLLLSTVPRYVTMSDVGFGGVAGSEMTMQVASGDRDAALQTFQSAWVFVTVLTSAVVALGVLAAWALPFDRWLGVRQMNHEAAALTVTLLLLHVFMAIQDGFVAAGYRATGQYARGTTAEIAVQLAEFSAFLVAIVFGSGPVGAAAFYLATRVVGVLLRWAYLKRTAPWIRYGTGLADVRRIRELARPAVAFIGMPAGNALSIQGMVMLIGAVLGPAAVVVFATTRTIVNMGRRAIGMINLAVWPELSVAFGAGNTPLARQLHRSAAQVSLALSVVMTVGLWVMGEVIIRIWTGGTVQGDAAVLRVLLLAALASAAWNASSTVLLASNRHARLALLYIVGTASALAFAAGLLREWGVATAAGGLLLSDLAMTAYSVPAALRLLGDSPRSFLLSLVRLPPYSRLLTVRGIR